MPFISTKTNVTVSKEKETQLKQRLGQAISGSCPGPHVYPLLWIRRLGMEW